MDGKVNGSMLRSGSDFMFVPDQNMLRNSHPPEDKLIFSFVFSDSLLRISEASILEGTRLGTPLPISLAHIVTNDTKLRGYTIPRKNTCVIANLYAGNR